MEYIDAKEMDQDGGDDARNKIKFDLFTLKIVLGGSCALSHYYIHLQNLSGYPFCHNLMSNF